MSLGNPVERFATLHYDRLVAQGHEMAALSPATALQAPLEGVVVRQTDRTTVSGYAVSARTSQNLFPQTVADQEGLGFTKPMQALGLWSLNTVVYRQGPDGRSWSYNVVPNSGVKAHYDGTDWHVVRRRPGANKLDNFAEGWQPLEKHLGPSEEEAIYRIATESLFVLDAAASFRDNQPDYFALRRVLAEKAQASANEADIAAMNTLLDPYGYLPTGLAGYIQPAAYNLADLAMPLYRALVGKKQLDARAIAAVFRLSIRPDRITSVITARESFCPPYKEINPTSSSATSEQPAASGGNVLSKTAAMLRRLLSRER